MLMSIMRFTPLWASAFLRSDSDIYNSMDAWPPDSTGRGGDGFIRLLDWETILGRSLGGVPIYPGMDTNNYIRFWATGDNGYPSHALVDWLPGGPPVPLSLDSASAVAGSARKAWSVEFPAGIGLVLPGRGWLRHHHQCAAGKYVFAAGVRQCLAGIQSGRLAIPGHRHRQQRRASRKLHPV